MKKTLVLITILLVLLSLISCSKQEETEVLPDINLKEICELSVMECCYHNVAKYSQEDADDGFLGLGFWKKDMNFWIEYTGIITLGIDASYVNMSVEGDVITITMPPAKVLGIEVDAESLSEDSFIVDKGSAKVEGDDQVKAIELAKAQLEQQAMEDQTLLSRAQDRAKILIEEYITNISSAMEKQYSIEWIHLDAEGNPIDSE